MSPSLRIGVLKERNFRLFFIGQATSQIGSSMAPVAVTFAVLAHGNATDVGLVSAAGLIPLVVLLLVGGVIADRFSRRRVMLTSDLLRTVAQIVLGCWILAQPPPLWSFMTAAALVGAASAFFNPAMTGLVPQVASKENLQQANAVYGLSGSIAGIVGPAIAGVIIAASSAGWAVLVDGLTYGASVLSLYLIAIDWVAAPSAQSFLRQLKQGWSEFWARTWLWVIVVEFSLVNALIFAPFFVLGPVVAKHSLGGAPAWGLALAFEGAGSLLGGAVMLRWRPRRPLLVASLVTLASAWPMLVLARSGPLWLLACGTFVGGVGLAIFGTLWTSTLQHEVPSAVLSRVSAYDWFGSLVLLPIGFVLVGPISNSIGITATILGATALFVVLNLAVLAVPSITRMQLSAPAAQVTT